MIAQTIQLSLAPVFVLMALCHVFVTLSARLGRIIDRSRELHQRYEEASGEARLKLIPKIRDIDLRTSLIGRSLHAMVISALCIGLTVSILFLEEMIGINLQNIAGGVFLLSLAWLMWGLLLFLRETRVALASLKIPQDYLEVRPDE
jgi:hypothetical protein